MIIDRDVLTPRELAVLMCVWKGMTRRETANELGLDESTIANRLYIMYGKWHVKNAVQLVRTALERGILTVTITNQEGGEEP